jgi:hypothetical protein
MRAEYLASRIPAQKFSQINGLSQRTCEAVRRLEAGPLWPGHLAKALSDYERFLRRNSGRFVYLPPWADCPCCNPVWARDLLQDALDALPNGTGGDLRRLVAGLDREFERRTLPDPRLPRAGESPAWWHYRLYEMNGY